MRLREIARTMASNVTPSPLLDHGAEGTDHSMTEHNSNHEAFEVSEQMRAALRLTSLGILVVDKDFAIIGVNPAARAMLNLPEDAVGANVVDLVPDMSVRLNAQARKQGAEFSLELSGRDTRRTFLKGSLPDDHGNTVILCTQSPALDSDQGRPTGTEQLFRLDNLMARLSHEMRNPLASILAGLQALEKADSLSPDDSFILKILVGEARTAIGIIERYSGALRTGTYVLSRIAVDRLVEHAVTDIHDRARKQQTEVGYVPGTRGLWIIADERFLARALGKLLQNALDACAKGGRIDVGWRVLNDVEKRDLFPLFMGSVVVIFGRDTGPGLPAHIPERDLFEPFVTTKPSAAGLGLSVARHIIESHGGTVTLHAPESEGTEFEVFLPLGDRMDCWEVMQRHKLGTEWATRCQACDARQAGTREFCWLARARSAPPGQAFPPDPCTRCPFFGAFSLVSVCKPSIRA